MQTTTSIDAVRGERNIYELDVDVIIGVSDAITFKCYHEKGGTVLISKTRSDMDVYDAANGKFRVILNGVDTADLPLTTILGDTVQPRALYYESLFDIAGGGNPQMIASGVMYLVG